MAQKQASPKAAVAANTKGTAQTTSQPVNAAAMEKCLKGMNFPANKKTILEHMRKNQATNDMLTVANKFAEKNYTAIVDVTKELSRVK